MNELEIIESIDGHPLFEGEKKLKALDQFFSQGSAFLLEIRNNSGSKKYFLKISPYSKTEKITLELLGEKLKNTPLFSVFPDLIHFDSSNNLIITEYIKNQGRVDRILLKGFYRKRSLEEVYALSKEIAKWIFSFQEKMISTPNRTLSFFIEDIETRFDKVNLFNSQDKRKILNLLKEFSSQGDFSFYKAHGDFSGRNIMNTGSSGIAVIDWEMSPLYFCPYHYDVCYLLTTLRKNSVNFLIDKKLTSAFLNQFEIEYSRLFSKTKEELFSSPEFKFTSLYVKCLILHRKNTEIHWNKNKMFGFNLSSHLKGSKGHLRFLKEDILRDICNYGK